MYVKALNEAKEMEEQLLEEIKADAEQKQRESEANQVGEKGSHPFWRHLAQDAPKDPQETDRKTPKKPQDGEVQEASK